MELKLYKQRFITLAFISRLKNKNEYLNLFRMMLVIPIIDIFLLIIFAITSVIYPLVSYDSLTSFSRNSLIIVFTLLSYQFTYMSLSELFPSHSSGSDKFISNVIYGLPYLSRVSISSLTMSSIMNEIGADWIIVLGTIVTSYVLLLPVSILFLLFDLSLEMDKPAPVALMGLEP